MPWFSPSVQMVFRPRWVLPLRPARVSSLPGLLGALPGPRQAVVLLEAESCHARPALTSHCSVSEGTAESSRPAATHPCPPLWSLLWSPCPFLVSSHSGSPDAPLTSWLPSYPRDFALAVSPAWDIL